MRRRCLALSLMLKQWRRVLLASQRRFVLSLMLKRRRRVLLMSNLTRRDRQVKGTQLIR